MGYRTGYVCFVGKADMAIEANVKSRKYKERRS
jgi:hypothetical protein